MTFEISKWTFRLNLRNELEGQDINEIQQSLRNRNISGTTSAKVRGHMTCHSKHSEPLFELCRTDGNNFSLLKVRFLTHLCTRDEYQVQMLKCSHTILTPVRFAGL